MNSFKNKVELETKERIQAEVKNEIKDKNEPYTVYEFNIKKETDINDLAKIYAKENKIPKFKFIFQRTLCCYKKINYIDLNGRNAYEFEKEVQCEINSSYCFWRVVLFIVRFFYSLNNFTIFMYKLMIDSMFGIKALIFIELYRDHDINHITGEITQTEKTTTFPSSVRNLWIMIQNSRDEFENAPDTGILGKGCMRIFHLFYNYVILLFLLGTLLIIFYPLMIFLTVIISTILIILSPALITIFTVLDYILTVVIYNRFDDEFNMIPFIFIILIELCFGFFLQFLFVFIAIIAQPILSLIIFIFAQIYFIARIFHNCIFISIIGCFGRVPQSDSCVAWQTAGPGCFVERFFDISNIDIICLVRGYLEKITMQKFQKNMEKMLEEPVKQINEIQDTFGLLGFEFVNTKKFEESIIHYKEKLNHQIKQRNVYPVCNLNVKFTEERLQQVKYMISVYVSEYANAYDLSYELNEYKKIDYFVEKILQSIFGYNILTPLETAEKLTHLKSVFDNEFDVIAQKIFKNPYFQDKIIVEENIDVKNDDIVEELGGPKAATFEQIFKGDLNLNFNNLPEKEKEQILNRSENLIKIRFQT